MDRKATLREYAEEHISRRRRGSKNGDSHTHQDEATACKKLWSWWDGTGLSPEALKPEMFEDFLTGENGLRKRILQRKGAGELLRSTSYNKEIGRLRPFIEWLVRLKVVDTELLFLLEDAKIKGAKPREDFTRLTLDQATEMIETTTDEWERFVLSLFVYSGGRESELLNRRVGHVGSDGRITWFRQKTQQGDRLPVMPELDEALTRWMDYYHAECDGKYGDVNQAEWWLVPRRGRSTTKHGSYWWYNPTLPCGATTIKRAVKINVARVLGVDPDSDLVGEASHILRRTSAYCLYESLLNAGVPDPMRIVMTLLGHKKPETTAGYIGVDFERTRRDDVLMNGTRWLTPGDQKPSAPQGGIVIPFRSRRGSASG